MAWAKGGELGQGLLDVETIIDKGMLFCANALFARKSEENLE